MLVHKDVVKRLAGLGILAVVAVLTLFLHHAGEAQQPTTYTVMFKRGTAMEDQAEAVLARAIEDAHTRHRARIVVTGHTGTRGDAGANKALSEERARVVSRELVDSGVAKDRIRTLAMGGKSPLERAEDESDRAYQRRLPRTEITIAP